MTPAIILLRYQLPVLDARGNQDGYRREFEVSDYRFNARDGYVWFPYKGCQYRVPLSNIDGIVSR